MANPEDTNAAMQHGGPVATTLRQLWHLNFETGKSQFAM